MRWSQKRRHRMSQPWVHGLWESSWTVAGSHAEKASAKAELVNLPSLCRGAWRACAELLLGSWTGPGRGREKVWVGTSTVLFTRP